MAPKREKKGSTEKRDAILRTTLQLFLKKGYSDTSTSDICSAAKLAKPSLYYYFGSKRNLLFSLHTDHLAKVLRPYLEEAGSIADPYERLTYMIRSYVRQICLHPELKFLIHESLSIRDKYFKEIRKEWKSHYLLLLSTISELQTKGVIESTLKPSWAALFLLGMITWITFWFDFGTKDQIDQLAESAVEFGFSGLRCGGEALFPVPAKQSPREP
jgi:AcrR family transcriptional regulator